MKYRRRIYLNVVGASLGICVAGVIVSSIFSSREIQNYSGLVFEPAFYSLDGPGLVVGKSRQFLAQLQNRTGKTVWIESLSFSDDYASGAFDNLRSVPFTVPVDGNVGVVVTMNGSMSRFFGPTELRFRVDGHTDSESVSAAGSAQFITVQGVNADPALVVFGDVNEPSNCTRVVTLWTNLELRVPGDLTVQCSDPCVSASINYADSVSAKSDRIEFATLTIQVEPSIAPSRLGAFVTVNSMDCDCGLRVNVTGYKL